MTTLTPAQVRTLRHHTGLSLRKLAAVMRLSHMTIHRWEQGKHQPSPWHAGLLARMAYHARAGRVCSHCQGTGVELPAA